MVGREITKYSTLTVGEMRMVGVGLLWVSCVICGFVVVGLFVGLLLWQVIAVERVVLVV